MTDGSLGDIDALVAEVMAEWQVPGLALAVVVEDEPVLVKGYGFRDVEASLPVTVDTLFPLASVTKSFAAAGLGILVDERKLDWSKPVRAYLPEFRLHDAVATDRVTVLDLLTHQSGLPRHDWLWMPGDLSSAEMLTALRHLEPSRDLRDAPQYCNLGYMVAAMVAERITGKTWETFTRERLMQPLRMTQVNFSNEDLEGSADAARPYSFRDGRRQHIAYLPNRVTGAGGINASIAGMTNYLRFHLARGRFDGVQLLSPARISDMQMPRTLAGGPEFAEFSDFHFGLGLWSQHYRGERIAFHGGGLAGIRTRLALLPDRRAGVMILCNYDGITAQAVECLLLDRLSGKDPIPWLDRFRASHKRWTEDQEQATKLSVPRPRRDPIRPLGDYAGGYEHPAYGRIDVEATADGLNCTYRGMVGKVVHRHYDTFALEGEWETAPLFPHDVAATFAYDREGVVDRVSIALEPAVAPIVFTRRPGGDVIDAAFLARCVGVYMGSKRNEIVRGDDGQLTLTVTGQPTYHLDPYQGRTFTVREWPELRAEFRADDHGLLDMIVYHWPHGAFMARRETD